MDAIDQLMAEHRLIEEVLGSLEQFTQGLGSGAPIDRRNLRDYADFFRNFADTCHHGKEEDRLFTKMIEHGFPKEQGPIAVMLAEHVEGRRCIATLTALGNGEGPLSPAELAELGGDAALYVSLLREHIQKEDHVLYPMALRTLPPPVMDDLAVEFEKFEKSIMGDGEHERFHALAAKLISAYPPAGNVAGATCGGCGGHE